MMNATKLIAAASLMAFAGTSASADDVSINPEGQRTIHVSISDLDLDSEQGMETLERRIQGAVKKVCGYTTNASTVRQRSIYRRCANAAQSTALASVENSGGTRVAVRSVPASSKK